MGPLPYIPRAIPVGHVNLDVNLADAALGAVNDVRRLGAEVFSGKTASAVDSLVTVLSGQSSDIHRQTGELKDQTAGLRKTIDDYNRLHAGLIKEQQDAAMALAHVSPYDQSAYDAAQIRLRGAMREVDAARTRFIASLDWYQGINGQPTGGADVILDPTGMAGYMNGEQLINLVRTSYDKSLRALDPTGELSKGRKVLVQFRDIAPDAQGRRAEAMCGTDADGNAVITIGRHNAELRPAQLSGIIEHEVTHAVQNYPGADKAANGEAGVAPSWVTEGLADYVRYFADGDPAANRTNPLLLQTSTDKWEGGYQPTAEFFYWMNEQKPGLVTEVHQAASRGSYSDALIYTKFGATSMEQVWIDFVTEAGAQGTGSPGMLSLKQPG
ncbi:basic secretory family protein [Gordonia alkaliphila]|uniref:basic secretory family protein n=1 Tax=Gordonia alkaliphila TaxID=1053547 RepID=UPI001FF1A954|nr:basic secretory family protein [Gordonia alkaliphila]MCK0441095.1 basic secretory family protein [Gordonia alkaliphila]